MRSSSQHTFARIPSVDIPRSSFKRNMTYKTTFNAGYLVPFYLDEVLPGDTFNFKMSSFARILSPLKYPIMDNLYMDFQFFFVPIRLVYQSYEKFFGSSKGPEGNWQYDDSFRLPEIEFTSVLEHSVADYFGLPVGKHIKVNALPFRCYNRIISDWYLPSSYEMSGPALHIEDSDDPPGHYSLVKRMKRCDYFTSALPSPQRGPGASLSIGGTLPVYGDGNSLMLESARSSGGSIERLAYNMLAGSGDSAGCTVAYNRPHDSSSRMDIGNVPAGTQDPNTPAYGTATPGPSYGVGVVTKGMLSNLKQGTTSGLYADMSLASAVSINDLRQAFQLQRALERDMRGGVRYVEQLMAHFSVRSPDARLQRAEYLGGGSTPINIHTVAQTTNDPSIDANIGRLGAFGVGGSNGIGWIKSFTEHGYVLGIVSVRADLTYQQGIPRLFDRKARFDFYYPVFSHLGEQAILNKEIYCQGIDVADDHGEPIDDQVFGYQERFGEYRYGVSKITGQLRSTANLTLDAWHLAQKFNNLPTLNKTFLTENVPMSRVKADYSAPDFIFDSLLEVNCVRPLPLFGVPGLVDHF